mgnify:CR=1 FL=1
MNELLMAFAVSFLLSLALTPLAAFLCRKFGLVDMPGERRINAVPVPRGGGMGIVVSVILTSVLMSCFSDSFGINRQMAILSASIAILGFVDDKVSLRPIVKLTGQIIISFLAWSWGGVGFSSLFPGMSAYVDCFLTVFWFVGAINAFNLIDGLDGLASGVALIGVVGMAGALYFCGVSSDRIVFHAVFSGALLGFLRYNFNPASVFLGDSGSMYIGFMMAALPLPEVVSCFDRGSAFGYGSAHLRHIARDHAPIDTYVHHKRSFAVRWRYERGCRTSSPSDFAQDEFQPAKGGLRALRHDIPCGVGRLSRDDFQVESGRALARRFNGGRCHYGTQHSESRVF